MSGDWFDRLGRHPLLLPPAERAKTGGGRVLGLLSELRTTERFTPAELTRRQNMMLLALARHSTAESPHFARRLKSAGLTPEALVVPGAFRQLPPLTRQDLISAGESMYCRSSPPKHGPTSTTSTSGSTGEPVTVQRTALCQLHWLAYNLREHLWHDRDPSGRLGVVRAWVRKPDRMPSWGPPCSLVLRTGPGEGMPVSASITDLCRWLADFDPDYLLILPNALEAVVDEIERSGQSPGRLRGVRTISETVKPSLREGVRRVLGVGLDDVYSSQEAGVMATECPEEGRYHVSESIILEIVDEAGHPCAPGETGRILITDLANFATPVIRYEIGDYAEAGSPCPCGRGLPTVNRFLGRERNLVLMPDGSRRWPMVGFLRYAEVLPVRQFQIIQTNRRTILARMVVDERPSPKQEGRLSQIIQESLGHPFEIHYEWNHEPLARGPGGKFEEFLCRAQ